MIINHSAGSFRINRTQIRSSIPFDPQLRLGKNFVRPGRSQVGLPRFFANDIYHALSGIKELFAKYRKIHLAIKPASLYPLCIMEGASIFSAGIKKKLLVRPDLYKARPEPGNAYIVSTEHDLAYLIKYCRKVGLEPGKDLGILSFADTPLKELLDITVITADVVWMEDPTALPAGHKEFKHTRNHVRIIQRSSL